MRLVFKVFTVEYKMEAYEGCVNSVVHSTIMFYTAYVTIQD